MKLHFFEEEGVPGIILELTDWALFLKHSS